MLGDQKFIFVDFRYFGLGPDCSLNSGHADFDLALQTQSLLRVFVLYLYAPRFLFDDLLIFAMNVLRDVDDSNERRKIMVR